MKTALIILTVMIILAPIADAKSPVGFSKLVNEVSFYKNTDDDFHDLGRTLQIISINSFRLLTEFHFEFTGDFNWDLTEHGFHDYYMELSVVKPVWKRLSFNYQRIYGTFVHKPVNQIGLRLSL